MPSKIQTNTAKAVCSFGWLRRTSERRLPRRLGVSLPAWFAHALSLDDILQHTLKPES